MKILVLNSGSSSLKYQVIDMDTEEMLVKGNYERIGQGNSFLTHKVNGEKHKFEHPAKDHEQAIKFVLTRLVNPHYGVLENLEELAGIGHRVVHGGEKFAEPVLITDEVMDEIEKCSELAPLHNPAAILGMKACKKLAPNIKMVAVFDTAFHQTLSKERYIYPIPYEYYKKYGIRKYGFHGTSHEYVAYRVAELLGKDVKDLKIVNCHLGQGASICAINKGVSVETSMGLTPLGGIPMGTRSGDLDPSVVTYIMKKENLSPDEMEKILNKQSGVFGISQVSVDFRDIENDAAAGGTHAQLALDNFHYQVASYVSRCIVAMNGIDVLTFTAGVGEKGELSREAICNYFEFMGLKINKEYNRTLKGVETEISTKDSKIKVFIIPTNEELMIARQTLKTICNK
ncbi:MAG: acetate/propionate family kinase [Clostridia bacterium]|nr:acetate kinase [Clostridium sp.]MBS6252125.1 acetate kinase [Clostridium sp.]